MNECQGFSGLSNLPDRPFDVVLIVLSICLDFAVKQEKPEGCFSNFLIKQQRAKLSGARAPAENACVCEWFSA
jgi:hypothetical protein